MKSFTSDTFSLDIVSTDSNRLSILCKVNAALISVVWLKITMPLPGRVESKDLVVVPKHAVTHLRLHWFRPKQRNQIEAISKSSNLLLL